MAYISIYRGLVTDRKDPEKRGRLMLKIPAIWGDDVHDYWALPKALFSGKGIGMMAMPEVGDAVWVQFENGDPQYPVWEYGGWNDGESLAEAYGDSGEPIKVALRTKSGQLIVVDDSDGSIQIMQSDGGKIKLDKNGVSLVHDSAISLGSEGISAQPAVLGQTNEDVLNSLCDALDDLVNALLTDITASTGQTYLLYPTDTFTKVTALAISITDIKAQIAKTKSDKVTLD